MLEKTLYNNAVAATKAVCKALVAADRCEPDQCEMCPAQQFLDMLDDMSGGEVQN